MKTHEIRTVFFIVVISLIVMVFALSMPDKTEIACIIGAIICGIVFAEGFRRNELTKSVNYIEATLTMFMMYIMMFVVSQFGMATIIAIYKMPLPLLARFANITIATFIGITQIKRMIKFGWLMLKNTYIKEGDIVEYGYKCIPFKGEIHRKLGLRNFNKFTIKVGDNNVEFNMTDLQHVKLVTED